MQSRAGIEIDIDPDDERRPVDLNLMVGYKKGKRVFRV